MCSVNNLFIRPHVALSPPCGFLAGLPGLAAPGRAMRSAPLFVSGAAGLPGEEGTGHRAWETRKACGDVSLCFPRRWGRRAGAVPSWRRGPGRSGGSCPRWAKLQQQCGHRGRPGTVPTPLGSCPTDGLDDGHAPRPPPPAPLPRPAACRALGSPDALRSQFSSPALLLQ